MHSASGRRSTFASSSIPTPRRSRACARWRPPCIACTTSEHRCSAPYSRSGDRRSERVRAAGVWRRSLQGIVHRDLKPENIFLSTNGGLKDYPKVLDFGLAKVTERELRPGSIMLTQEGMVFGTPEFMSPEQAQGKVLDARSDIYSLATILYEVLTGKLPFDARTPMEYIQLHVTKPPIPLDERVPGKKFPPGLGAVLAKALEKKPEDRYGRARSLPLRRRAAHGDAAARRRAWRRNAAGGACRRPWGSCAAARGRRPRACGPSASARRAAPPRPRACGRPRRRAARPRAGGPAGGRRGRCGGRCGRGRGRRS